MRKLGCAVWELTLACNMRCKHCGSSAGSARLNELSTEECFSLCEELAQANCDMVSLMGGEPFVHPDWYDISWCVKDLGMNLAFVSNGLLVPNIVDKLSRLEPTVVGISLDGIEKTHDSIRRDGSFKVALEAIDMLLKENIQVTVITTISKTNFSDLLKLRSLLKKREVNWQIQIAEPFGNFDRSLAIDEEEYYASAMFIVSENVKNKFNDMPVVGAHCYGYHSHLLPKSKKWKGCTAGISSIGITSDGSIVGCLSMGNNQYVEGNVRERSFVDIWEDSNSFAYNRSFDQSQLGENCKDCFYGLDCKGGCNSVSLHFTGQLHNTPYCMRRIEEEKFDVKSPRKERVKREVKY